MITQTAYSQQFSIVVIPDTQWYAELAPEVLESQIDWIVAEAGPADENIIYVAHLGDLKDDLSCDNKTITAGTGASRTEWQIVDQAFSDLDGANIAYGVVPGNHDFDQLAGDCPDFVNDRPLTIFNSVFGPERFGVMPEYGGNRVMGSNEDNYLLFDSDGIKFIAINLAYKEGPDAGPGEPELDWADALLKAHPDRLGIVTSHYFMDANPGNSLGPYGVQVYDWLANNPNFFMMLSAHEFGEAWLVGTSLRGGMEPVQVLLQDYQNIDYPGDGDAGTPCNLPNIAGIDFENLGSSPCGDRDSGFMRIMRFDVPNHTVNIETFIPPETVIHGRTQTITSDFFPPNGNTMGAGTASNIGFSYLGYSAPPSFDIFECDDPVAAINCTTLIGTITFPIGGGDQEDGSNFTLTYDGGTYDDGDLQLVDWEIDASTGELIALTMRADSDPGCLGGTTPPPCSQTTQRWDFLSPGLTETSPSGGSCGIDPMTMLPYCISSIAIGPANLFVPVP
jgi:hypothetical protein